MFEGKKTITFFLLGILDVGDDVSSNQPTDVESANEVDSDDLLKNVQWLRLTVPEHDLHEVRKKRNDRSEG